MSTDLTNSELRKSNLQLTFALHEAGILMMQQNLRRRHPDATEDEICKRLQFWLEDQPLLGERVKVEATSGADHDLST